MPPTAPRLLPTETAPGLRQMALDEALLEVGRLPVVRVYRWTPAGVSLGCFQDHAAVVASLPRPVSVVRRITGGGAIWHEHEVTWCLVAELGRDGVPARSADIYAPLHAAIRARLAAAGAGLDRQSRGAGDRRYVAEPRCFASPAAEDLIRGGAKVLGSAARARGARVLVHGSLKLAGNAWDADAAVGCGLDREPAEACVLAGLGDLLGATPVPAPWTAEELARAEVLSTIRGDPAWIERREGARP